MAEPIKVGDLVQVVRTPNCCGSTVGLGMTRTVIGFSETTRARCVSCGRVRLTLSAVLDGPAPWSKWHIEPSRLKRIPPLSELEGEKRDEEITA